MRRRHQQHELVGAHRHLEQSLFGRPERQRAEVEAPLLDLDRDLPGRHAANVDGDVGIALTKPHDQRQQGVHGRFVRADQHAAAAQVAQVAHRRLGFLRQPDQPLPVVLQHACPHR